MAANFFPIKLLRPMTRRVIGTVGQCIYCGSNESLSDEHVIPYSLGGRDELHRATCKRCADITSSFELRLARSPAWWPLRRALDLNSRRRKKQPNSFPVRDLSGPEPQNVELPLDQYPLLVPFFVFDAPGLLKGNEGSSPVGRILLWYPRGLPKTRRVQIDVYPAGDFAGDLVRLLAKAALGYAVAAYSLAAFEEIFVKNIILGDVSRASAWVGGWTGIPAFQENMVHGAMTSIVDGQAHVTLQLFRPPLGHSQTPVYHVIVGRMGPRP